MTQYSNSPARMKTAYHEAGHVAVGSAFHPAPFRSVIVREDGRGGYCKWQIRLTPYQHALVHIAGAVAERLFTSVDMPITILGCEADMSMLANQLSLFEDYAGDDLPTWACELAAAIHEAYGLNEYKLLTVIMEACAIINKLQPQICQMAHEFGRGRRQMFTETTKMWTTMMNEEYHK